MKLILNSNGYRIEFDVHTNTNWYQSLVMLKQHVFERTGISVDHQKLLCNGKIIRSAVQFSEACLHASTLKVMLLQSQETEKIIDDFVSCATGPALPKIRPGECSILNLPDYVPPFFWRKAKHPGFDYIVYLCFLGRCRTSRTNMCAFQKCLQAN